MRHPMGMPIIGVSTLKFSNLKGVAESTNKCARTLGKPVAISFLVRKRETSSLLSLPIASKRHPFTAYGSRDRFWPGTGP